MTRAAVIARRELGSYFYSPIAYVAMTLFLIATGLAFGRDFRPGQVVAMRSLLEWMVFFMVGIIPILTMGLLAQEWSSGTIETLMTAPVGETEVVLGKFLGSLGFFLVLLCPTVLYAALMAIYSTPGFDFGPVVCGYLGMVLVGALFIAIGLFCSSLTRLQMVAAVVAASVLTLITVVPWVVTQRATLSPFWRGFMDQLVFRRYADFSKGMLDTGHVVFFLAMTGVFLFLTVKVLESRRWR
jgi:ABC-2 type transport system permease protein